MTHLDDAALDELARLAVAMDDPNDRTVSYEDFEAAANPATVSALVAEVRRLRQCLAGVRHSVQMGLAGLQDEPAFAVPLFVHGLARTIDAIDAALDGGQ